MTEGELFDLFCTCFPHDSPEFISEVINKVAAPDITLALPGAAVLVPRFNLSNGQSFGYVYCLCTAPEHRGKGLMSRLLSLAEELCAARGDSFVALVPASPELGLTYGRRGYRPVGFRKTGGVPAPTLPGRRATERDIPALNRFYEEEFGNTVHVRRDEKLWKTLMALYSADGGGIFLSDGGYLFAEAAEGGLVIREKAGTPLPDRAAFALPAAAGTPHVLAKGNICPGLELNLLFD